MEIAVLITTFNRKEKTVICLQQLQKQILPAEVKISIYLTDDASKDGTAEAAATVFPDIHIYHGNGNLFWAGGMRKSWGEAMKSKADFFLLINDDTVLTEDAIKVLLNTYEKAFQHYGKPVICIGSTKDAIKNKTSYGGRKLLSPKKIYNYLIENNESFAECDLGNANIMMVQRKIAQKIGILSDEYTHGIADYDYTLTAKKNGFPSVVAPSILGYCQDDHGNSWKPQNSKLKERIAYLYSPKGLAYKEYLHFIKKNFPTHYYASFSKLWLKTLFPFVWDKWKK